MLIADEVHLSGHPFVHRRKSSKKKFNWGRRSGAMEAEFTVAVVEFTTSCVARVVPLWFIATSMLIAISEVQEAVWNFKRRVGGADVEAFSELWKNMTSSNGTMDPNLWSNLQHHISLENVYLRLPVREFFQLRGVCKDWNSLAHQRRCFTEIIQKPYFVIVYPVTVPGVPYHAGILTFHIASGQWRWKPLPVDSTQLNPLYVPFSVKGLVFSSIGDLNHLVYDAHAKRKYHIRMQENMTGRPRVLGMAVDTSVMPYTFKLILGGLDTDTQISEGDVLDRFGFVRGRNGVWEMRSSRIPTITGKRWPSCMKSCLQCDDHVYIWWQTDTILVYSLKEDAWSTLNPPRGHGNDGIGGALGSWDSRLFVVMEDRHLSVSVWELLDQSKQAWRQFARIPAEIHACLVPHGDDSIRVLANFCDQYVLIYTLLDRNADKTGISDNFILFNLDTKLWEKTGLWEGTDMDSPEDTRRPRYRMS